MLAACGFAEVAGAAAAARGGALDRRRAGAARGAAAARRRSTTATAPSSPPPSPRPAARRCGSAPFPTTRTCSRPRCATRLASCDMVVLSGGTSKGAGDLSYRILSRLGSPGVLVHGVALKPGKPLCLAVIDGKPIAVLPGFPTSAIFTFHEFVAPVIRARAGLPPQAAQTIDRHGADPDRLGTRTPGIRAGGAGAGRTRAGRVPDRQRFGRGDLVLPGRRLHRDRCAQRRSRCRRIAPR